MKLDVKLTVYRLMGILVSVQISFWSFRNSQGGRAANDRQALRPCNVARFSYAVGDVSVPVAKKVDEVELFNVVMAECIHGMAEEF